MLNARTTFIIGAGASKEFGLPLGVELAKYISAMMDIRFQRGYEPIGSGDHSLFDAIQNRFRNETTQYQDAAWLIRDGVLLSSSIDDFLNLHEGNDYVRLYGKAAIVKAILEAERNSTLFQNIDQLDVSIDIRKIADSWLVTLMRLLGRDVPIKRAESIFDNATFVVFNYDRCVEQFFRYAIRTLYGMTQTAADAIVSSARILHVYGSVGPLPNLAKGNGTSFGGSANYIELTQSIRTYTEQISDESILKDVQHAISEAERLIFLGFAFHLQNLKLLASEAGAKTSQILATAKGFSDADCAVIRRELIAALGPHNDYLQVDPHSVVLRNNLGCADLFLNYQKTLGG